MFLAKIWSLFAKSFVLLMDVGNTLGRMVKLQVVNKNLLRQINQYITILL